LLDTLDSSLFCSGAAGKKFRIGYLDSSTASGSAVLVKALLQELAKLGWIVERGIKGDLIKGDLIVVGRAFLCSNRAVIYDD